jgi:hypothetical protein
MRRRFNSRTYSRQNPQTGPAHQLLAERDENPLLDLLAADGQAVRAGAAGARAEFPLFFNNRSPTVRNQGIESGVTEASGIAATRSPASP